MRWSWLSSWPAFEDPSPSRHCLRLSACTVLLSCGRLRQPKHLWRTGHPSLPLLKTTRQQLAHFQRDRLLFRPLYGSLSPSWQGNVCISRIYDVMPREKPPTENVRHRLPTGSTMPAPFLCNKRWIKFDFERLRNIQTETKPRLGCAGCSRYPVQASSICLMDSVKL